MLRWMDDSAPSPRHRIAFGAAGFALALTLSACGGSSTGSSAASTSGAATSSAAAGSSSSGGGSSQGTAITATEADFSISLPDDSLSAGDYTITIRNTGHSTHDLAVEKDGTTKATSDSVAPGGSASLTVTLQPGDYVFYCSIDNHRAMGMETTVHVR